MVFFWNNRWYPEETEMGGSMSTETSLANTVEGQSRQERWWLEFSNQCPLLGLAQVGEGTTRRLSSLLIQRIHGRGPAGRWPHWGIVRYPAGLLQETDKNLKDLQCARTMREMRCSERRRMGEVQ